MSMKLANEIKTSLVTVVCILALAVISKNILHVQMDFSICANLDVCGLYERESKGIKNLWQTFVLVNTNL